MLVLQMTTDFDVMKLPPGTKLGAYVLKGQLGQGGMGTVYLAEQTTIGRQVALKVLNPDKLQQEGALERFITEAKTAAALQHQNLVTIHDVGQIPEQGVVFYSMDYIHGRMLYTKVRQEGPLAPGPASDLIQQVAGALGYAHHNGLIHRDVKPENVIIDEYGIPKLTDLGLAVDRFGGNGAGPRNARSLAIVGTPTWSPPEQLRNPSRCTAASDVWSLGALYYFLLTAEAPFTGESLIDLAINIATVDPLKLDQLDDPEHDAIRALMAKDPAERPADGKAALAVLRGGTQDGPSSKGPTTRRRSRRRRR